MKYHELSIESNKGAKRVGRGIAAGGGKTAGRGTKGQHSRTGSSRKPGFEGGQNPLMQRLPKLHGFRSYKVPAENVYTGQLNELKSKTVDNFTLAEADLVSSPYVKVKLLVQGDLTKAIDVSLQAASENAVEAVKKAGGKFNRVPRIGREKKTEKTTTKK